MSFTNNKDNNNQHFNENADKKEKHNNSSDHHEKHNNTPDHEKHDKLNNAEKNSRAFSLPNSASAGLDSKHAESNSSSARQFSKTDAAANEENEGGTSDKNKDNQKKF